MEIKSILASVGLTVAQLERQMGLSRGDIQYVLDRGSLRYDLAQKIAAHIGKKISWVDKEK